MNTPTRRVKLKSILSFVHDRNINQQTIQHTPKGSCKCGPECSQMIETLQMVHHAAAQIPNGRCRQGA